MGKYSINFQIIVGFLLLVTSCVPVKQFTELKSKSDLCLSNNDSLKEENRKLTVDLNEIEAKAFAMQKKITDFENEEKTLRSEKLALEERNESLQRMQDEFENQLKSIKSGSSEEITKLLQELQNMQANLLERENKVKAAGEELRAKEQKLKDAQDLYEQQQSKLMELQKALDSQKDAVEGLKGKLNQALRGFYDQGLTVHEKNGKIYVSLEEQLLFKTGSYTVDVKGQEAIKKLGEVLANNKEVNILVEGHTDDVPLTGSGQIKDNWDLSVMRSTAVTRILLLNKSIDPKRITSAGRGEFFPIDNSKTPEARKKNRRTEIILTPNLGEVLKLIQSN